jgi:hypothetical protein
VRYDKRADIHAAFLSLARALICWQSLLLGRSGLALEIGKRYGVFR